MKVNHEQINYKKFGKCLKIFTEKIEVIVTLDIGPRVISYRRTNGENIFWEDEHDLLFLNNEDMDNMFYKGATWHGYGGHRLWRAPESFSTYYPDNFPVTYYIENNVYVFKQKIQPYNEIQEAIKLSFIDNETVVFEGIIKNKSKQVKELSCWSISMCKGPGIEIVELPNEPTSFIPQRHYSLWGFGALNNDSRAFYGDNYYSLRVDHSKEDAYKAGMKVTNGKVVYIVGNDIFIKSLPPFLKEIYPDNNVNYETYTKKWYLEMESLSPLKRLQPEASLSHKEIWNLYEFIDDIPFDKDEKKYKDIFDKYVK